LSQSSSRYISEEPLFTYTHKAMRWFATPSSYESLLPWMFAKLCCSSHFSCSLIPGCQRRVPLFSTLRIITICQCDDPIRKFWSLCLAYFKICARDSRLFTFSINFYVFFKTAHFVCSHSTFSFLLLFQLLYCKLQMMKHDLLYWAWAD
jgi:hypothetical protein